MSLKRVKRSKNGERRQRTLIQMEASDGLLLTQLAAALNLSKIETLTFAITNLKAAIEHAAKEGENVG